MTVVIDIDAIERIALEDDAIDAAIECATEATYAGYDPQDQLISGIKAYLWYGRAFLGWDAPTPSGSVPIPVNKDQAKAMILLGHNYMRSHHPEEVF